MIEEYYPTEFELFEEKAQEIFESFLESMWNDNRFTRDFNDDEKEMAEAEGWSKMWKTRAGDLVDAFHRRVYTLAVKKFGEKEAQMLDIDSPLYREE